MTETLPVYYSAALSEVTPNAANMLERLIRGIDRLWELGGFGQLEGSSKRDFRYLFRASGQK